MKKFVITEQDRKHILSRYGLLNEQAPEEIKQGSAGDPYKYKKEGNKFFYAFKEEGDKPNWIQSKILRGVNAISQNIFKGPDIAKTQDDLNKLYAFTGTQSDTTTTTTTQAVQATGAGSGLSGAGSTGAGSAAGGGASTTTNTTTSSQVKGQSGQVTDKFGTRPDISGIQNTQTTTQQGKDTLSNQPTQQTNTTQTNTSQQPVQYGIKDIKDLLKQKGFKVGSDENKLGKMTLAAIEKALLSK